MYFNYWSNEHWIKEINANNNIINNQLNYSLELARLLPLLKIPLNISLSFYTS